MASLTGGKSARFTVTLNPNDSEHPQNSETVQRIVASILNRAGCGHCGRLALMEVQFQGDPGPEMLNDGVISVHAEGG